MNQRGKSCGRRIPTDVSDDSTAVVVPCFLGVITYVLGGDIPVTDLGWLARIRNGFVLRLDGDGVLLQLRFVWFLRWEGMGNNNVLAWFGVSIAGRQVFRPATDLAKAFASFCARI